MRIIDAHMHLGEDLLFGTDDSEEVLLDAMDAHGIAAQIVQPGIVARDQKKAHERIRRFAERHPGRCHGVAVFNPLMDEAEYRDLVRWTVKDLGFKGVKLHPNAFCMAPTHPSAQKIFRVAEELDIVVMIHTGNGLPNALPSLCIPVAREHPALRIVLAHAGGGTFGADAIVAAEVCPNIFLETSWVTSYDLASMVRRLGERRVMFGTDLVNNIAVELAKYRSIGLSESQLEWCFARTAESVFRIA
jgi:predicted TIM-barrel fold metal-dependent hydrolase